MSHDRDSRESCEQGNSHDDYDARPQQPQCSFCRDSGLEVSFDGEEEPRPYKHGDPKDPHDEVRLCHACGGGPRPAAMSPFPCTMCGQPIPEAEAKRTGVGPGQTDRWLVHKACLEKLGRKPAGAQKAQTLDEAFAALTAEAGTDEARDVDGYPVSTTNSPTMVPRPPSARARARVASLEGELLREQNAIESAQARAAQLALELKQARTQANVEQHEEDARGWAAALFLCLEHSKAVLQRVNTRNPPARGDDTDTEYEFQLFSGERLTLRVHHRLGARPPRAVMGMQATFEVADPDRSELPPVR